MGPANPEHLEPAAVSPASFDERALIARACSDPSAFGVLYRAYVDRIYAFAYRRTWTREAAEDVTAATFERALRHLERFDADGAGFGPWLFRIAANELVDHYRREGRTRSDRGQRGLHVLAGHPVEDDVDAIEREDEVRAMIEALGTLRPRYQRALTLRYLAGLSADEAATAMGCSKPVLAVTLHRALGALRRAVEPDSSEPTA
jgi:RNA polymerase sigma-70 factor (ECF subfamily)